MSIVVEPMRWPDLAEVAVMEQDVFQTDPWSLETWWSELAGVPTTRVYIVARKTGAEQEQSIIGYGGLALAGGDCDIQTVAVSPVIRGYGLGRDLLERLLAVGRERGARWCHLEVEADNEPALALYRKLGFDVIARRPGYYRGRTDALVMKADLGEVADR